MTTVGTPKFELVDAAAREQQIRTTLDSLSYLPTAMAVAMKFVELGRNPDADPADYAKVISADSSLSCRLLAMANSPHFGVRNKVTSVRMAVNLLGLGTIRTLAISYCMAGLHNDLRLTPEESNMFWRTSLCKAVAASTLAGKDQPKLKDEAFVCGMLQDFALPLLYVAAREEYLTVLHNRELGVAKRLAAEKTLFNLDHMEVGRMLAHKLELPEQMVDAVAFHHNTDHLGEFIANPLLADAIYASSLFPHSLDVWSRRDADSLCTFLNARDENGATTTAELLQTIQQELDRMLSFFEDDKKSSGHRLADMMIEACRENADRTTQLVCTVQELMQDAASMGMEMTQLLEQHDQLQDRAHRDALTSLLNREGLRLRAEEAFATAARYGLGMAVVYIDLDRFKPINDNLGHEVGDRALTVAAQRLAEGVRQNDIVSRIGGDEFLILLCDCPQSAAEQIVQRIIQAVAAEPIGRGPKSTRLSASAGLLYLEPSNRPRALEELIPAADKLMYRAKQSGGSRMFVGTA